MNSLTGLDPSVIAAISGILAALVTGIITVFAGRKKANSDIQSVLNSSFQALVSELQEERVDLTAALDRCSSRVQIQSDKIDNMDQQIRRLRRHILSLEDILFRHDITFMPLAALPFPPAE